MLDPLPVVDIVSVLTYPISKPPDRAHAESPLKDSDPELMDSPFVLGDGTQVLWEMPRSGSTGSGQRCSPITP
jgi:hypothetical protein